MVAKRHVTSLLGRNGAGKTTTIRTIMGFSPARRGRILFRGHEITRLPSYKIANMGIGLVPQSRRLFPSLTVREHLTMVLGNAHETHGWNLDKIYSLFPILKKRSSLGSSFLSGGEQQMLAIARALLTQPALLLMDEPSEGLAPLIVKTVASVTGQLKEEGLSILLVEQNLPLALGVSDHVYVMSTGKVVFNSNPKELEANKIIVSKYLGV